MDLYLGEQRSLERLWRAIYKLETVIRRRDAVRRGNGSHTQSETGESITS